MPGTMACRPAVPCSSTVIPSLNTLIPALLWVHVPSPPGSKPGIVLPALLYILADATLIGSNLFLYG